jgi:hypothetical protein
MTLNRSDTFKLSLAVGILKGGCPSHVRIAAAFNDVLTPNRRRRLVLKDELQKLHEKSSQPL